MSAGQTPGKGSNPEDAPILLPAPMGDRAPTSRPGKPGVPPSSRSSLRPGSTHPWSAWPAARCLPPGRRLPLPSALRLRLGAGGRRSQRQAETAARRARAGRGGAGTGNPRPLPGLGGGGGAGSGRERSGRERSGREGREGAGLRLRRPQTRTRDLRARRRGEGAARDAWRAAGAGIAACSGHLPALLPD